MARDMLRSTNPFLQSTNPFVDYVETTEIREDFHCSTNPFLQSTNPFVDTAEPGVVEQRRPVPRKRVSKVHSSAIGQQEVFRQPSYGGRCLGLEASESLFEKNRVIPRWDSDYMAGQRGSEMVMPAEAFIDDRYRRYVQESVPALDAHSTSVLTDRLNDGEDNACLQGGMQTPELYRRRPVPSPRVKHPLNPLVETAIPLRSSEPLHSTAKVVPRQDCNENAEGTTNQLLRTLVDQFTTSIRESQSKRSPSTTFRPVELRLPRYDGTGDVHLFIKQFEQVARIGGWDELVTLVQLRSCLERGAKDCGRADSTEGVFARLVSTFGRSPESAREQLHMLVREPNESYSMLGNRVERLAQLAYAGLGADLEGQMALEHFCRVLDSTGLRQHMLLARPVTVQEAVKVAEQFVLVSQQAARIPRTRDRVAPVDGLSSPCSNTEPNGDKDLTKTINGLVDLVKVRLDEQSNLIKGQSSRIANLERSGFTGTGQGNWKSKPEPNQSVRGCYKCGDLSHFKRNCPNLARPDNQNGNVVSTPRQSEN